MKEVKEGMFYWVRPYRGDDFEPAKCRDTFKSGSFYMHFTNGSRMPVGSVFEIKHLQVPQ
jgi:hypothetical protein